MFVKFIVDNIMTPLTGSVTFLCNVSSVQSFRACQCIMVKASRLTVVLSKSDSDVIFCLQLLSKTFILYLAAKSMHIKNK